MTTPDVIRFAVSARSDFDPKVLAAIKTTLLAIDQTSAGRATLKSFSNTAMFTHVGSGRDASFGTIQSVTDYVEYEIVHGGVSNTR